VLPSLLSLSNTVYFGYLFAFITVIPIDILFSFIIILFVKFISDLSIAVDVCIVMKHLAGMFTSCQNIRLSRRLLVHLCLPLEELKIFPSIVHSTK